MKYIPLTEVIEGERVRHDMGDLVRLAESIRDDGLLHPIVLNRDNKLVAGGRRLAAHHLLADNHVVNDRPEFYSSIPYLPLESYLLKAGKIKRGETLSDSKLRKLELQENHQRKSMHWTEKVLGLWEFHKACRLESLVEEGTQWTQAQTGDMLGLSQSNLSLLFSLAETLHKDKDRKSPLWKLETQSEAIRFLMAKRQDELSKELVKRARKKTAERTSSRPASSSPLLPGISVQASPTGEALPQKDIADLPPLDETSDEVISMGEVANMFFHGDALTELPKLAELGPIHHILTDPPYGIDMDALSSMESIDRIESTHEVKPNIELLQEFLRVSFDCIEETGFMCMWFDLVHYEMLTSTAEKIGWRVCRWPFHWCKTSPCLNGRAERNFTKAVEHCLILRRSEKSVLANKVPRNYVLSSSENRSSHPFYKPASVWNVLIEAVSHPDQTIVDPFCGEGSMLVPAFKAGRVPLGIELDEAHHNNGITLTHQLLNESVPQIFTGL